MKALRIKSGLTINGLIELTKEEIINAIKSLPNPGEPENAHFPYVFERYILEFLNLDVGNWIISLDEPYYSNKMRSKLRRRNTKIICLVGQKAGEAPGKKYISKRGYSTIFDDLVYEAKHDPEELFDDYDNFNKPEKRWKHNRKGLLVGKVIEDMEKFIKIWLNVNESEYESPTEKITVRKEFLTEIE